MFVYAQNQVSGNGVFRSIGTGGRVSPTPLHSTHTLTPNSPSLKYYKFIQYYKLMQGFMANFDYISGENSMEMKIPMTAPVIFRKSVDEKGWQVSFYVPSKFETMEAIPVPKVQYIHL